MLESFWYSRLLKMAEAFPRDVIGVEKEVQGRRSQHCKKFLLINTNVVLAFDSQEICRTPGETENIDKYNTGAMKIHLTVRRRFNLIDFKIDFISLFYINRTSAFVSILNCLTT